MNIKPIQSSNRIIYLDILRGMAILFIFIANIYVFSGWYFMPDEIKGQFHGAELNSIIKQLTVVFIDGKWYSIFSILFGIGFVIQYDNAKSKNLSFVSFFIKRMLGLLLIGLIHLFFLWQGDILTLYALIGFLLLFFRNFTNKRLLIWAGVLLFLPVLHLLLMIAFDNFYPQGLYDQFYSYLLNNNIPIEEKIEEFDLYTFAKFWMDGESWQRFSTIQFGIPLLRYMMILIEGRIFKVLACFLIGIWAGRMILNQGLLQNKSRLKKIALFGLIIGISMNIILAYCKTQIGGFWNIVNYVSYALGVVPLACGYAALVALFVNSNNKILEKFAPVGQMALTNYLFQTIISILFFYGIGFGFAFDLSLWKIMLFVFLIFAVQLFLSDLWLRHFRYGPIEWLWRMMTYQKVIKNKK